MLPSTWTLIGQTFILVFLLAVYALPSMVALFRRHPKRWPIVAVNLIGGFFGGIGWVVAMVWCFVDDRRGTDLRIEQLERLERLKQSGSLTAEEFEQEKGLLLQPKS